MRKESFVYGAAILVLSSVINRILGFIYQVFIIRLIGAEGIGLFSMVYPIYVLLIVISTAGIPVAVAKFVAEELAKNNLKRVFKILKLSLIIMGSLSIIVTISVYYLTPFLLGTVFPNPNVYWCFISLLPGIFIVAISSAFRGFFQGLQNMTPTAVSQTIEQIIRVVSGLIIAYLMLPHGIIAAAIGASLGVVLGELTGLITMLVIFWMNLSKIKQQYGSGYKNNTYDTSLIPKIIRFSIPVTLSRIISTVILSIDAIIIPQQLQIAGNSLSEATIIYGKFTGMSLVLLFIPTVVTISLATSLVPAISEALAQKNWLTVQYRSKEALRLTIVAGLPSLVTFYLVPNIICQLLFRYPDAGDSLRILAIGGIFLFLQQTTNGILQGLGEVNIPLINLLIGSTIKVIGIFILTSIFGIIGTALSMNIGFFVVAILNIISLSRKVCLGFHLKDMIIKPGIAAIGSGIVLLLMVNFFKSINISGITMFIAIMTQFISYVFILILLGGIYKSDIEKLPFVGRKFISFIESVGIPIK